MLKKISLYFHTLRHLKFIQLYWRVYLKLRRFWPVSTALTAPVNARSLALLTTQTKYPCYLNESFLFLNQSYPRTLPMDWKAQNRPKLWLYNLHYFDYLNQPAIDPAIALELMRDWMAHNRTGEGCAWEPYPISLRIVNWIKFLARTDAIDADDISTLHRSLFLQSRFLAHHLEYHLLGNHLFKNAVALLFAGQYFTGDEARGWLKKGLQIFQQQLQEQILPDGGHFERSPMYHALILEDILDCLNLDQAAAFLSAQERTFVRNKAQLMLNFLSAIVHQDLEIPFFNDCALNIALAPAAIFNYAHALGLEKPPLVNSIKPAAALDILEKPDFGLYVLENASSKLIFDAGCIGPDYLPGHAHCDTLSYELSIAGQRFVVNSGTYQYAGDLRNHFRATTAHNAVCIDGREQHEIWSTFRVARRGCPAAVKVLKESARVSISASYAGYQTTPDRVVHRRTITCRATEWLIADEILGSDDHAAASYIHLHPDVVLNWQSPAVVMATLGRVRVQLVALNGDCFDLAEGFYASEFGIKQSNAVLVLRKQALCPFLLSYQIKLI